ncbi:MAG: ceramidase domain-containing protein [Myxococcota bacterium]
MEENDSECPRSGEGRTAASWPWLELLLTAAAVTLAMALLVGVGLDGWPGRTDDCLVDGQCFCEIDRGGLVRQRSSTLSNLGFVAVGLGIAWSLGRQRSQGLLPRPGNLMTESRFYPGFYALLTALLGPGSMALHASLTWWGSVLDLMAMNVFIAFVFGYAVVRWKGLGVGAFLAIFGVVNAVLLAVKLIHGYGSGAFGVMAVASIAVEVHMRRQGRRVGDGRLLAAAAGAFLGSFGVWLGSQNGGVLCDPDSWLQGHAVWHLGCAVATGFLYLYMRSEREAPAPAGS